MNSIHDMGGMTCFGPIVWEDNEPLFHAPWEGRVAAQVLRLDRRLAAGDHHPALGVDRGEHGALLDAAVPASGGQHAAVVLTDEVAGDVGVHAAIQQRRDEPVKTLQKPLDFRCSADSVQGCEAMWQMRSAK